MGIGGLSRVLLVLSGVMCLAACDMFHDLVTDEIDPSGHMYREDYRQLRERGQPLLPTDEAAFPPIPQSTNDVTPPPPPKPAGTDRLVSVSVTDTVPLRDVLIELARESKVNLELDPRIAGGIIFTAHNQPFNEVLKRICRLAGLRSSIDGNFIHIELDEPYQKTYPLDFLSLARHSTSETSIATNVFDVNVTGGASSSGNGANGTNGASASENNSTSRVSGNSEADLWAEVSKSVAQILASNARKTDRDKAETNFSIDKQAGLVTVFGDSRQQDAIETYFRKLRRKAEAQVLIDARIIEVELDDSFKSGIDWAAIYRHGFFAGGQAVFTPSNLSADNVFTGKFGSGNFGALLQFVRSFGTTRVLSSPRLTVLNNQTAMLKVATNQVYFVTQAQFTTVTNANGSAVTTTPVYTSTPHTVPVGLVMTVQPAIDTEHGRVTMTLRPTISRIVSQVDDPSIGLNAAQGGISNPVVSQIPVLAVREMDSVIRLRSGEVAIMGGLMQDSSMNQDQGIPGLDEVPVLGPLAKSRDNHGTTTELVILLRATIADQPAPDIADSNLYEEFGKDPRPLPTRGIGEKPLPKPPSPSAPANDKPDADPGDEATP